MLSEIKKLSLAEKLWLHGALYEVSPRQIMKVAGLKGISLGEALQIQKKFREMLPKLGAHSSVVRAGN